MRFWRNPLAGAITMVTVVVFDMVYVMITPCHLSIPGDGMYVIWVLDGCSFGMQTGGLIVTAAGVLVGVAIAWVILPSSMRSY